MRIDHPICPTTGKKRFRSKHAARHHTAKARQRLRVYVCPDCHSFHVTKRDTRP